VMKPWRLFLFALFMLFASMPAWAVEAQASLDRDRVQLGEVVTLNVRVRWVTVPQPIDLKPLSRDFDVLASSSDTSVAIVNGNPAVELTIGIVLQPKHVGALTIPPLSIAGQQTSPVRLDVDPPDPVQAAVKGRDAYLEASIEPARGYVGQQLQYVLKLYYANTLSAGSLDDPKADGMSIQRLGNDLNYEVEQGGRRYHVVERHYAVLPLHAGHLTIPPVAFQGEVVDLNDPGTFFPNAKPVNAATPAVSFDALDIPAGVDKQTWLPVRDLKLTEDDLPGGDLHVGQAVTLTMLLQATGTSYESLPALSLPPIDGANVYPDKPLNGTRADGNALVARRQQGFAIVPTRPGTLTIPEITVHWWNVATGQPEVARLPERQFHVLPAPGQSAIAPAATTAAPSAPATVTTASTQVTPWRWVALASLGLWVASIAVWWYRRRQAFRPVAAPMVSRVQSTHRLRAAFLLAARGGDAAAQAHALLAWARTERPQLRHLGELAAALAHPDQREAVVALERRRYAAAQDGDNGALLAERFAKGFTWSRSHASLPEGDDLPELYPFDVHGGRKQPTQD